MPIYGKSNCRVKKAASHQVDPKQMGHRPPDIISFKAGTVVPFSKALDHICSRGAAKWVLVSLSNVVYVNIVSLQKTAHL